MISNPLQAQDGLKLVWSDEFDGNTLDLTSWEYQTGNGTAYNLPAGWGNNELQYYTNFASNVSVSGGTLKIVAREQNFGGLPFTSARIRTKGMRDFLYGRFEGRMIIPSTSGVWPAFWMLPTDSPYGGWASSGEIDIMESVNIATTIHGTIHHGAPWPNNQANGSTVNNGTDFSQDFHEYAVEWDPDEIRWYLDGQQYHSVTSAQWFSSLGEGNVQAPFNVPFHILLNVAVGGNFPGNPNGSANYPQTLEVDYVRVYERVQTPFGGTPHAIPGTIEAEDFDIGMNGQSYQDCDSTNFGGDYRETAVDIQAATVSGFNVGWICEGEWIEYTALVETTGEYQVDALVSSQTTGGSFHIEVEGIDLTGPIQVPVTNGWQNWQTTSGTLFLEEGEHVIRFVNDSNSNEEYNFNLLTFTQMGGCSLADVAEPYGSLNFFDVSAFLSLLNDNDSLADINGDGQFNFFDVSGFLTLFGQGCP
ncbi:MAG: family 16 glycosylhydrolase [Phycisphaerales bacterium]|nr:family 16 glycosylhydrolase [Phycisphaerales bacterium]